VTKVCAEFADVQFFIAVKWWFWCVAHCFLLMASVRRHRCLHR